MIDITKTFRLADDLPDEILKSKWLVLSLIYMQLYELYINIMLILYYAPSMYTYSYDVGFNADFLYPLPIRADLILK